MSSACTSGNPALIMVANCRVITTMSRVLTPPPNLKLSLNSRGAARTCTTTMRFLRRWAMTSSRLGRSIFSLTRSPLSVRAGYWKTGIAHSLRGAPSRGAPPRPLAFLHRLLGDHALGHERELGPDLRLLVRGEDVDDPVDALHRRVGVQGREGEVAGLGDGERRRDRLEITHLADQHDVGVLPQRVLERGREAVGVRADLALVHDAGLMAVDELDRVLHRDDVSLQLLVDLVDHRREGGALPRAGGPRDQDQPAGLLGELRHHGRQAEILERAHVEGDLPDHQRHAAPLLEAVAAEAREVLDAEGEVQLVLRLEALLLVLGEHRVGDRHRVLGRQHVLHRRVHDVAVDAYLGTLPRHDVEVGGVLLDHLLEQRAEIHDLRAARRHAAVSFTTSSRLVIPRFTLTMPSERSVSIPSLTASSRSSSVEPPFSTIRRNALDIAITSYSPCRPLYPVPPQLSQPAPL